MSAGVTVIVCTRNRAALLGDCLRSILADGSTGDREIVVVDNGSSDETPDLVAALAADAPCAIRRVAEPRLGHAHARNAGIDAASGGLLLFTDDDVLVERGWTDEIAAAFADPAVGAVAGRILPLWPFPPPAWLDGPHAQLLTLIDYGPDTRPLRDDELPLGANMAVRTAIARSFDPPFDPRLGHAGTRRMAHEEFHFMNRVRATHRIAYAPNAVIRHRIGPERIDIRFMRRTFLDLGVGLGRRERIEGAPRLDIARRVVRAWRTVNGARRCMRRNDAQLRTGADTWEELSAVMWAGKHLEMLLGRFPRLTNRFAALLARAA
jgi:glycosyltransferase involved in cell wall biosynthesis